jgi:UDP-N-acetylmuramoyl-tripeptide--D-alanyl-D-alanine ligase
MSGANGMSTTPGAGAASVWTDAAVTAALGLPANDGGESLVYSHVSTDTRTLRRGSLFVALRGEVHDGHAFLALAEANGATGAVVDAIPADAPQGIRYYVVHDSLHALGQLGRFQRRRLNARVCAVAGSNGKTTTKELLRAVLNAHFHVHATSGNFNNLIGAPLTLLAAPSDIQVIISEIGTNTPGEIAKLAGIVEPDAAVITGISAEHLEGLGDLRGVLREECSVLPWLRAEAVAIVADEPAMLAEHARILFPNVKVAGLSDRADEDLRGSDVELDEEGRVSFRWLGNHVQLKLRGRHNARNALLALGLARAWGIDGIDAIRGLEAMQPPKMRTEFHKFGDLVVIADCYNANPASLDAAVDLLASMPKNGGRIAVLGSMLELGPTSAEIHAEAANDIATKGFDLIIATGAFVDAFKPHAAALGDRLVCEADPLQAWNHIEPALVGNEVVLLKGSRGVALERLLPRFEQKWGLLHLHGEAERSQAATLATGMRDDGHPAEHPRGNTGEV